ncbi:glycosyltransferase family 4 protein [Mangrovimonas spongiae]|uniref:Glycosyltransferase family 4 protein n=1 Tax=Mangrovimonas spongiae TaxID=2494697 RepID=A0A428K247_9FLAO|nr:glycosyltransferase family 4 protein [Mangrovimonas spongiae]RSK40491.1 glycosyltransferase family 4 protein [Mangrovimonas spongiae]
MKKVIKYIVIVTSEFPPLPGGIGNHAYNLAKHLQIEGYEVTVLADQRSEDASITQKFDAKQAFTIKRVPLTSPRVLMYVKRFQLLLKTQKSADLVIATGKFSLWVVAFCGVFSRIKNMAIIHGSEVNYKTWWLKQSINLSLKQFDKIVAVSNYTKSLVKHLRHPNITVIPNGYDGLENASLSEQTALKGQPALLTVGNVTERKGQLNVITHLPELIKYYPEVHYHCVGFNTKTEAFIKEAERLGVSDYVTFHGHVLHEQLSFYYTQADIFVMLSMPTPSGDVEGFGIAILEANAFGVPAIGATGCGIEDAINPQRSGILVNPNDTTKFIEAINTILKRKPDFSKDALAWAKQHEWPKIVKRYVKIIVDKS